MFDEDGSGSLDFLEFTLALNCTNLNKPEDKLRWTVIRIILAKTNQLIVKVCNIISMRPFGNLHEKFNDQLKGKLIKQLHLIINISSWIFNVFDEDGGGTIDVEEVQKLVVSLLKLTENPLDEENISECVKVD